MAAGVVDVTADSDEDVADVVDISDSEEDEAILRLRSGAPPLRFHGYRRGRELGRGATGKVFVCNRKGCSSAFAAKAVDLRRMQMSSNVEREHTSLCREVEILKSLPPHPNIVQLVDAFEEGDWFLLILELVGGGDLYTALTSRDPPRFLEPEAVFVLRQLADGMAFLHGQGVIHRDLKLENVLVASERRERPLVLYTVKITDFGLSKAVGAGLSVARSLVGTAPYTAPEVLAGGEYDFSSDLWCLGVLLYVLLAGRFPFDRVAAQQEELDAIVEHLEVSTAAKSLLAVFLQLDPSARPSLEAISSHEWFHDGSGGDEPPVKRRCLAPRGAAPPTWAPETPSPIFGPARSPATSFGPLEPPALEAASAGAAAASAAAGRGTGAEPGEAARPEPIAALGQATPTPPQAHQASGIGEWMACIYSSSRSTSGAPGCAASSPDPDVVSPASRQPDVMQLHVVVPGRLAREVLGKAGAQMRQIAATVGCGLRVLTREGLGHHLIALNGSYNQCVILQELLHTRLLSALRTEGSEPTEHSEVVLMVRAEAAGVVIGKQGFMLKMIRKRSGATIRLLREQVHSQRPCILTGAFQEVLRAERHVFDLVRAVPVARSSGKGSEVPVAPAPPSPLALAGSDASPT